MHIGEENGIEKEAIVIEWVVSSALLKSNDPSEVLLFHAKIVMRESHNF